MMKLTLMLLAAMALGLGSAHAGGRVIREYVLFGGSNTDSTEQASAWIPVFGASKIYIRTWSGKAAWSATTDADSTFSDSITTFKAVFTDSTPVNYRAAAETLLVNSIFPDTSGALVIFGNRPINKELRGPSNGSGIIAMIVPTLAPAAANTADVSGIIAKHYMRIRVTPLRRSTQGGTSSTTGKRVNGLRLFRMRAYVVYDNFPN